MAFDDKAREFGRELIHVVEIDQKACSLTYGIAPCTASGSGDGKCYNTLTTCQDVANYNEETRTYRFCEPRSPHPVDIDAIPSVESVNITPAEISVGGGFGSGSKISINFFDHPHNDDGIDDYADDRTFDPYEVGSFWTKFRARNKFYEHEEVRVLTGFIVNDKFDAVNFETRHFVIQELSASNGAAMLRGGDVLSRITEKKPLAPAPSVGALSAAITAASASVTLTPAGVYTQYPASGKARMGNEVVSFVNNNNDTFTITRAQHNTVAATHAIDDTFQLCLEYTPQQINLIIEDLLTTYGNIPASYINSSEWQQEANAFLTTNASALITEPTEVNKLIKELGEQFPHSLYWDDKKNEIVLKAVKEPPASAPIYNQDQHILRDSFSTRDRRDLQVSTVYVRFGQIDPTKKLDEVSNYAQSYVRVNTDAIERYESNNTKIFNSRWIANGAKASAIKLASSHGRRFGFMLRELNFDLDLSNPYLNIGDIAKVQHRDIVDFNGNPDQFLVQITGATEKDRYKYRALEYSFDQSLPGDLGSTTGQTIVFVPPDSTDINLRALYNAQEAVGPGPSTDALFILESGWVTGANNLVAALDTGSWPAGATVTLLIYAGASVVGLGGESGTASNLDGGDGIILNHDLTLINNGVIGGGGGGGQTIFFSYNGRGFTAGGGGGGGFGTARNVGIYSGNDGGLKQGGAGGGVYIYSGGDGGNVGQNGSAGANATGVVSGPGVAGAAIDRNGFTLTQSGSGNIYGAIIN